MGLMAIVAALQRDGLSSERAKLSNLHGTILARNSVLPPLEERK
jgi:hypothetical protein